MRGLVAAVLVAVFVTSSIALAEEVETIVVTSADVSKMSNEERLARICQASTMLKIELASERHKDWTIGETAGFIVGLSCSRAKRR